MSICYSIICEDCKKYLWIGQSSRTFYSGEPHTMEALREFLFNHMKHHLTYDSAEWRDEIYEENGWEEIDANKYKKVLPEITKE